jgi:hypothetical protein
MTELAPAGATIVAQAVQTAAPRSITPMEMLGRAIDGGAGIDVLEKLMALQERWEARQAQRAFDEAIAAAKVEIKPIFKNRVVDFTSARGRTHYRHEDMGEIAKTVDPVLGKYGLSYRYRATSNINEPVSVTCVVTGFGHREETTLTAARDDTGNKNGIQAIGSTITFLQRYSLKVALGLAASNDDDGAAATDDLLISEEQIAALMTLAAEVKADVPKFCKVLKVERLDEVPASKFQHAIDLLKTKRKAS